MKGNLTAGLDKGKVAVEQLLAVARRAAKDLEQKMSAQQKVIDELYAKLGRLEQGLKGVARGSEAWNGLGRSIGLCREELGEAESSLRATKATHQQLESGVGALERAFASLSDEELDAGRVQSALSEEQDRGSESTERLARQLKKLEDTRARMRQQGERDTEEYRRLSEESAALADTLGDVRDETRKLADDDANLKGFASGVQGLAGAFTAATGVMSLFASENENLARVQARLQSVMAITMGLQQAFNTLNKDSYFRLVTLAKAKDLLTAANGRLAAALGISTAAASALMAVLTVGISVAIVALVAAWNRYSEAQEKAAAKTKEFVDALQSAGREYGENRVRLAKLKEEWDGLTSDDSKRKWIEENREEFEKLDVAIDDVGDAENVFVQNTDVVIESLKLRAKAAAYAALATQKYQEALVRKEESKARRNNPTAGDYFWGIMEVGWDFDFKSSIQRQANKAALGLSGEAVVAEREAGEYLELEKELLAEAEALRAKSGLRRPGSRKSGTQSVRGNRTSQESPRDLAKEVLARRREEILAMSEYLKEYGSFQQQKLAIAKEYAQKIADVDASELSDAAKAWQKKKLQKEQQQKEASLSFENISRGIDWHALFSGVGNLTKEMMVPMMEQLQAYVQTDEYRQADAETQQKVTDLIQEMRQYVGTDQSVTWQSLEQALHDFTEAVARYDAAKSTEDAAVLAREEGKKQLAAGQMTEQAYKQLEDDAMRLGDATAQAREDLEYFGNALNRTSEEVVNFTSGLTKALHNAKGWDGVTGMGGVKGAVDNIDALKGTLDTLLPQMGDGMAKTIGTTLSSTIDSTLGSVGSGLESVLSSGLGSMIGIVAQIPGLILNLASAIKNMVVGVLDSMTELISMEWIEDLVVSLLDAVGNLIDAIFDLPENLLHVLEGIVVDGVGGLVNSVLGRVGNVLSFGLLSSKGPSDWFTNSNADEVAATIERLTARNALLETAIEDLTDVMKSAHGSAAIDASRRAEQLQREVNANYLEKAKAQADYHSAHHRWSYYWGGFSEEQIQRLSEQIGRQWSGDLWDLSPEEMKMLRSNIDMWNLIGNTGKGPYGEAVQDRLNEYIDQAGKLEEITNRLNESLTGTSQENVYDDFLDSLYALADGSKDVTDNIADDWQKMVNRMVVNNLVFGEYQQKLTEWYKKLAKIQEMYANGEISDYTYRDWMDQMQAEYEGWMNEAKAKIEGLRSLGVVKTTEEYSGETQSGRAGGFTAMSQSQGTKLEGLFVSGQMHWSSMDDKLTDVSRQLGDAGDTLKRIEGHTGSSAQSLGAIMEAVKMIQRDGLKVK